MMTGVSLPCFLKFLEHFESAQVGHHVVEDQQVWSCRFDHRESFFAAARGIDGKPSVYQLLG